MKLIRLIRSKKGNSYIDAIVFVIIAVILMVLIINIFSLIAAKQKLDLAADQMTRQIQGTGKVDNETKKLFNYISSDISGITSPTYTIDATYYSISYSIKKIQYGTPFYVNITATVTLGGFGNLLKVPLTLTARSAGVSEVYWK